MTSTHEHRIGRARRGLIGLALVGALGANATSLAGDDVEVITPVDSPAPVEASAFGAAVAIEGDRLVVGTPLADASGIPAAGVVDVYQRDGGTWQHVQRLEPPVLEEHGRFGATVAIDGGLLVVGAPDARFGTASTLRGRTWVYEWNGVPADGGISGYELLNELDPQATNPGARFGFSADVSGDRVVAALPSELSVGVRRGAVVIYDRAGDVFNPTVKIRPGESSFGSRPFQHGYAVALHQDLLVIGALFGPEQGTGSTRRWGQVWIRERSSATSWPIVTRVRLGDTELGDGEELAELGVSVATDGTTIVIGLPARRAANGIDEVSPAALVLRRIDGDWSVVDRLEGSEIRQAAGFGRSVAVDGDRIIVAAPGRTGSGSTTQVAVFEATTPGGGDYELIRWIDEQGAAGTGFASAVALSGDDVVIGAPVADGGVDASGRVFALDATDFRDCDGNGIADPVDIFRGDLPDCNGNDVPDACDLADGTSLDCNDNGLPDECDIESGSDPDCNGNGRPDSCDLADGTSLDRDFNGVPDECQSVFELDVPDDYATIADALAASFDGDRINVGPGTWVESITPNGREVRITGTAGAESTIIQAPEGAAAALVVENGEQSGLRVRGLTLSGTTGARALLVTDSRPLIELCVLTGGDATEGGGALLDGGGATLVSCVFRENTAIGRGGGLLVRGGASVIEGCVFTNNEAGEGGGFAVESGAHFFFSPGVDSNGASGNGGGGWVGGFETEISIQLADIFLNESGALGGGLFVVDDGAVVQLVGADICDNLPDQVSGPFEDVAGNEICAGCVGDLDGDGEVAGADLTALLASWGPCDAECAADLDGDGEVSGSDLTALLANWGPCPG